MSRHIKIRLSDKRKRWLGRRTVNLKGTALNHNIGLQARYAKSLNELVNSMTREYSREIKKLLQGDPARKHFAEDSSIASAANILFNHLEAKFRRIFKAASIETSSKLITDLNVYSQHTTEESLKKISGGLTISTDYITEEMAEMMKAFRYENQQLTLDLEQNYSKNIRVEVMESIRSKDAGGMSGLTKRIESTLTNEQKKVRNRAKNIAADQTRRAYNNLNAGRMQASGIRYFEWLHSHGGLYPRKYHMDVLDGNIYKFDEPPIIDEKTGERGIPGQLIGCKCSMIPVLPFNDGIEEG